MKKVKAHFLPGEVLELDGLLTELMARMPTSDDMERCVIATLRIWQIKKLKTILLFPVPAGHTLQIEVTVAFALRAVLEHVECDPAQALGNKLLQLSDSIQKAFVSPIS